MASLNNNPWVKFAAASQGDGAMIASDVYRQPIRLENGPHNDELTAAVYGTDLDLTDPHESWQVIEAPTPRAFFLRNRALGPGFFLNGQLNVTIGCFTQGQGCQQCTVNNCVIYLITHMAQDIGAEAQWNINSWNDGSYYYLYNERNGSNWRLDLQDSNSWTWLHGFATDQTDRRSWHFDTIGAINDQTFSTVATPTATAIAQAATVHISKPLSTGAKAGIGIGAIMGAIMIIATIILGLKSASASYC